jgi:hypothetical protein
MPQDRDLLQREIEGDSSPAVGGVLIGHEDVCPPLIRAPRNGLDATSKEVEAGTVSLASKALPSVPGPGAFHRRRGRYFAFLAANVGGPEPSAQGLDRPLSKRMLAQALPHGPNFAPCCL